MSYCAVGFWQITCGKLHFKDKLYFWKCQKKVVLILVLFQFIKVQKSA